MVHILALENTEGTDCIWSRFVYQQWRMHYKISNGTFWVLQIVSDENHRRELKLQVWTWKARQFICVIMQGSDDASGGWGWGLHHIWMDLQIRKRQATRGPLTTDHGACMLSMGTLCWIMGSGRWDDVQTWVLKWAPFDPNFNLLSSDDCRRFFWPDSMNRSWTVRTNS